MIKESEIRVGNIVSYYKPGYDDPVFDTIVGLWKVPEYNVVYYLNNHSPININGLLPIPLTPDILERAGFEIDFHDGRDTYHKRCYLLHLETFTVTQELNGFYFGSPGESSEWYTPMGTEIKYVHQLQNLYHALTGSELEIKAMAPSASHTS